MKILHTISLLLLLCLLSCHDKKENADTDTAETSQPIQSSSPVGEDTSEEPHAVVRDIIHYDGASAGALKDRLEQFAPFSAVSRLSETYTRVRDSLEYAREVESISDPADTLFLYPHKQRALAAIQEYKTLIESGKGLLANLPSIMELERIPQADDSSRYFLPEINAPGFFTGQDLYFLGGAPFLNKAIDEENEVFRDPKGNPEIRFIVDNTENGNYIMNCLYLKKAVRTKISFGPPLRSHDSGPQDVNGIGSLIHEFVDRMPVQLITAKGIVNAQLIGVTLKIMPEGLGCISDQPEMVFATAENLDPADVLAIVMHYDDKTITACTVTRQNDFLWTADLNNDQVPDIACVSGMFEGISSDALSEVLWYVNVNGEWKIMDYAMSLDCT